MKLLEIYEEIMGEAYPTTWDIETFKGLKSFAKRIKYCEENLQRISSGSSRIVYKIDDEKVLKLAKNKKGLSQNEIEIEYSGYYDLSDILARTFDYADDNTWVEMELARRVTAPIFKQIVGFDWKDYIMAMDKQYRRVNPQKSIGRYREEPNTEIEDKMWENEFCYSMFSLLGNYDIPVGDLLRFSSYGVVNRNGKNTIVLIDYGLNNENYESYYS
jgi:hypothetical protein